MSSPMWERVQVYREEGNTCSTMIKMQEFSVFSKIRVQLRSPLELYFQHSFSSEICKKISLVSNCCIVIYLVDYLLYILLIYKNYQTDGSTDHYPCHSNHHSPPGVVHAQHAHPAHHVFYLLELEFRIKKIHDTG